MIKKIHVNYIPSFYKRPESNSSGGDLAHPLYVFIQLFVLSKPLFNFAQFSSQEDLCFFCPTNLQFCMWSDVLTCVCMTTRAFIDLHSVQLVAHFVCLGSILSVQCAHFCTRQKCIFVHIVHPPCEFANIVLFCTFCDQFATLCISPMAVDTVYSCASQRRSQGPFLELGAA